MPVGTYLSGGMDSSLVSILAARTYPSQLQCFTGAFREGPEFDERPYAREVAAAVRRAAANWSTPRRRSSSTCCRG